MILGNDISYHQGKIDFKKMKSAGSKFVYIRIGTGYTKDSMYENNKRGAKEAGLLWGHYYVPIATSMTYSLINDGYLKMAGNDFGDLPPALDVETNGLGLGLFKEWIDQVEIKWKETLPDNASDIRKKLTFYTRASHFDQYENVKNLKQYIGEKTNLWVAHYTYDPINKLPSVPKYSWGDYLIHQYSADENKLGDEYGVSSVAIDMDYFNGDDNLFSAWSGLSSDSENPIEDPIDEPEVIAKKVSVTADWLRLRASPEYVSGITTLVVEKGQILEVAGDTVSSNNIIWLPVRIPSEYKNIDGSEQIAVGYVSNKYVSSV
jgi:lysozyme